MHIFIKNFIIILQDGLTEKEQDEKVKYLKEQLFLLEGRHKNYRGRGRGRGRDRNGNRYVVYQRNTAIHFN